jgi:hypothetical protein
MAVQSISGFISRLAALLAAAHCQHSVNSLTGDFGGSCTVLRNSPFSQCMSICILSDVLSPLYGLPCSQRLTVSTQVNSLTGDFGDSCTVLRNSPFSQCMSIGNFGDSLQNSPFSQCMSIEWQYLHSIRRSFATPHCPAELAVLSMHVDRMPVLIRRSFATLRTSIHYPVGFKVSIALDWRCYLSPPTSTCNVLMVRSLVVGESTSHTGR